MQQRPVIIIGAGLAGIAAARQCVEHQTPFFIFEKENRPGGLCRTEVVNDFYFDYTGHLIHFQDNNFASIVKNLMGENLGKKLRNAWIYSKNTYTRYPFQMNLYGLPIDTIVDCIYEYSRSHFDKIQKKIDNYEDWILSYFGKGIADHFMIPYNTKIFKTHPRELSQEITGRFVPGSSLRAMIKGALVDSSENVGYNSEFFYPVKGGIESLVKELSREINISTNESVDNININEKRIRTSCGQEIEYSAIISTQPIPELIKSINNIPDKICESTSQLKWVSVLNLNFGIKGIINDKHWIYFPEQHFLYHRIGCTHNFSSTMTPEGYGSLYLEVSYNSNTEININDSVEQCTNQLISTHILKCRSDIVLTNVINLPFAYVLFDKNTTLSINSINEFLNHESIYSAGRFGSWKYSSMEDAYLDGKKTAEIVLQKSVCTNS